MSFFKWKNGSLTEETSKATKQRVVVLDRTTGTIGLVDSGVLAMFAYESDALLLGKSVDVLVPGVWASIAENLNRNAFFFSLGVRKARSRCTSQFMVDIDCALLEPELFVCYLTDCSQLLSAASSFSACLPSSYDYFVLRFSQYGVVDHVSPSKAVRKLLRCDAQDIIHRGVMAFIADEDVGSFCSQISRIFTVGYGTLRVRWFVKDSQRTMLMELQGTVVDGDFICVVYPLEQASPPRVGLLAKLRQFMFRLWPGYVFGSAWSHFRGQNASSQLKLGAPPAETRSPDTVTDGIHVDASDVSVMSLSLYDSVLVKALARLPVLRRFAMS